MTIAKVNLTAVTSVTLLATLSSYWAVSTFTGIEETFSTPDLIAFAGTGAVAVLIQILVIFAIDWWVRRPIVTYAITGLFVVINAFSFNLAFAGDFLLLGTPLILLILAAGWFVAIVIVRMADENPRLRPFIFSVIAVLIASPFVLIALHSDARTTPVGNSEFTASPEIRKVNFRTKPNVYFIGFDAAAPAAVLKKYLELKDAPLPLAFKEHGFRVFPNLFTETPSTSRSWKSLLALNRKYYSALADRNGGLFRGVNPSPLIQIFQHNGYEVSTLYKDTYFGDRKGPYVDFYEYNQVMSVCDFIGSMEQRVGFFGACLIRKTSLFPKGVRVEGPEIAFLAQYLKTTFSRQKPQAIFAHIHPPKHVDVKTFSRKDPSKFRLLQETYYQDSVVAGRNLRRLRDMIAAHEPDSIIFVFGDHGLYLATGESFRADRVFYVQDSYGVLGGVYPANTCSEYFDRALADKGYLTTAWVARLLVRCLAGGDDPMPANYVHKLLHRSGSTLDPKEFVYE